VPSPAAALAAAAAFAAAAAAVGTTMTLAVVSGWLLTVANTASHFHLVKFLFTPSRNRASPALTRAEPLLLLLLPMSIRQWQSL
jgi:Na+(H+)/acetate symporter ActP